MSRRTDLLIAGAMDSKASHSALRQYYVAVGEEGAKLATLVDLLRAFEAAAPLGLVVACGARDSLDEVCAAAMNVDTSRVWCLHADMSEREVENTVQQFKDACSCRAGSSTAGDAEGQQVDPAAPAAARGAADREPEGHTQPRPLIEVLAMTEVCLKVIPKTSLPLNPDLLINYDLPTQKELYLRRITAVLGGRASAGGVRVAVHFAVAGRLGEFAAVESFAERQIEQMPVHVADVLQRDRGA